MSETKVLLCIVSALAVVGCATQYRPGVGELTASLEFVKGYDKGASLGAATTQFYAPSRDKCAKAAVTASFGMLGGSSAVKPVGAGQLVYVEAETLRFTASGLPVHGTAPNSAVNTANCKNRVGFVPQPDGQYRILQRAIVGQTCQLEIRSLVARFADPELQVVQEADCPKT